LEASRPAFEPCKKGIIAERTAHALSLPQPLAGLPFRPAIEELGEAW